MYKWIGNSAFPRKNGEGKIFVIYLAEQQPDGTFRPLSNYYNGRTSVGSFVAEEVYNAALALKLKFGDDVKPSWGPRAQIALLEKA